nr:hypothetical protein [Tanacetum cinerariifolium]
MVESLNQEQIPPQQEQILQQQDQPDKPGSPIPFKPATQVEFNIDEITFNANNEVALPYPPHSNSDYFKSVSEFIFKCYLREAFTKIPNQYEKYLFKLWYTAKTLEHSKEDIINNLNKKTREKVVPYPRFLSLLLEHKMEGADKPLAFKALKTSSKAKKKVTQGKQPRAKSGRRRKSTSSSIKHNPLSKITKGGPSTKKTTGSKTGHSKKRHDASVASTTKVVTKNLILMILSDDAKKKIKLEDLLKLILNVEVNFIDLDSPGDDIPIIIQDEDEEEVHAKKTLNSKLVKEKDSIETKAALLKAKPSFPNVEQLTELLVNSLKPEQLKLLSYLDFSNSLPTKVKELPSKFKYITKDIRELKKFVEILEIELP